MREKIYPEKVVIFRTDRIGEVLLSTASIDVVKRFYPRARVTFVTSGYSRGIVEGRKDLEKVLVFDTMGKTGVLKRAFELASVLKKEKYDLAVVLNPHKALHLACFLAGIPRRVGYDRKWGFLLNDRIKDERDKGEKHEIEYLLDVFGEKARGMSVPAPRLFVDMEADRSVSVLLMKKGINSEKPIIAVHPGSSNPAKIWPKERYRELARRLAERGDRQVVIIGDEKEKRLSQEIAKNSGESVFDLTGELDLKGLTAFLSRSRLFIGNDTGPMHIAASLGVPVIAIFGRNIPGVSPRRWRPWGDKHVVFHEHPGCVPCYDSKCPYEYKCLTNVTVDAVFAAAKRMLNERT